MSQITNNLLRIVQQLIGGSGAGTAPITVLDDDSVTQTLPIVPEIARRSLVIGPLGGIFVGVLRNVHSGADGEVSNILPYAPLASNIPPYPSPVPDGFDIWLLGVAGGRVASAGGLTGALMGINPPTDSQGWGRDDGGTGVSATGIFQVARFDALEEGVTLGTDAMITEQGLTYQPVNLRIMRGATIVFATEAAAAATFDAQFYMGLFPAGMGQDVST